MSMWDVYMLRQTIADKIELLFKENMRNQWLAEPQDIQEDVDPWIQEIIETSHERTEHSHCTTIEYTTPSHPSLFLGISDQMMTLTIEHVDHVQIMDHADGITLKIRHHGGNEYQCSNFNINCSIKTAEDLLFWIVPGGGIR